MPRSVRDLLVGSPVAQTIDPSHADQPTYSRLLTPASPNAGCWGFLNMTESSPGSGAFGVANCPLAVPFWLQVPETVYQLGWFNGSAAGGNVDVGVYDSSWNRKISTTSTVGAGNSALQFVDVTDTALTPGKYYMVITMDTTTANRSTQWSLTNAAIRLAGCYDSATTALPLPDPLTNMVAAATFTALPVIIVSLRALV